MSFMILKCPACGAVYTFGVVGMTMIGTGHVCPKQTKDLSPFGGGPNPQSEVTQ